MSEPPVSQSSHPPSETRTYAVHGIRVSIHADWSEFLVLSDLMFGDFRPQGDTSETLSVDVGLQVRGWFDSPAVRIERQHAEERLGTNEFLGSGTARYAAGKLDVRYTDGRDAHVSASYILDRSSRLRRLVGRQESWDDEYALFRLAVHEPVLLKLERRGAVLLHASAVSRDGRALILVGLNGGGKSTLCASLLDRLDYVSDNFVALDAKRVLGFPSALRMPGPSAAGSRDLPAAHGKHFLRLDPGRSRTAGDAQALVFLSLGSATYLTPLTPDEAFQRLLQVQDMTHEFPRHTYLGPLAPPPKLTSLEALSEEVPAYRLVVSRTNDARDHLLSLL